MLPCFGSQSALSGRTCGASPVRTNHAADSLRGRVPPKLPADASGQSKALSLRALGERSGVAYDTINKLELGRRPAHASTIRKLAEALGVEPKELMKGET
jgi:lambda repressor-like predicted transcriptional regulator